MHIVGVTHSPPTQIVFAAVQSMSFMHIVGGVYVHLPFAPQVKSSGHSEFMVHDGGSAQWPLSQNQPLHSADVVHVFASQVLP
jgi:hypothetical protein